MTRPRCLCCLRRRVPGPCCAATLGRSTSSGLWMPCCPPQRRRQARFFVLNPEPAMDGAAPLTRERTSSWLSCVGLSELAVSWACQAGNVEEQRALISKLLSRCSPELLHLGDNPDLSLPIAGLLMVSTADEVAAGGRPPLAKLVSTAAAVLRASSRAAVELWAQLLEQTRTQQAGEQQQLPDPPQRAEAGTSVEDAAGKSASRDELAEGDGLEELADALLDNRECLEVAASLQQSESDHPDLLCPHLPDRVVMAQSTRRALP